MAKKLTIEDKVRLHKKLTLEEKIERQYVKYSQQYNELKKKGITKKGYRKLGKRQFINFVQNQLNRVPGATITTARKQAIEFQSKFGELSEAKIRLAYKVYQSMLNDRTANFTYFGRSGTGRGGADNTYHRYTTIETFKAGITPHQMISLLVTSGMSNQEAIEEYGY